jgi:NAD(P)-dependent dehydrogenase (short-subunit alcohol dehydrogenase family)
LRSFAGRTAVVTGAARGIGAAIAAEYVARGGTCLLTDIDDAEGELLAAELGPRATYRHLDVTDAVEMETVVRAWAGERSGLDHFFSNAGAVGALGSITDTAPAAWTRTIDLLLNSTFFAVRSAGAVMRVQGEGAIVCTASVASLRGGLGPHAYTAAKHGVLGLIRSAAAEFAGAGVRINAVAPGGTVTGLSADLVGSGVDDIAAARRELNCGSRSGVATEAADIAAAALFLAGDEARRINGAHLVIDGGEDINSDKALDYYAMPVGYRSAVQPGRTNSGRSE